MVIDTSAILAILFDEPDAEQMATAIASADVQADVKAAIQTE